MPTLTNAAAVVNDAACSTQPAQDSARQLAGAWVRVRPAREILATLDARGTLEGLPFMPEMAAACGKVFRVRMRADRACVHPPGEPFRKLTGCVVLDGLRCGGEAHGGCQLGCMTLWKEAWLSAERSPAGAETGDTFAALPVHPAGDETRWSCQATELGRASVPGAPMWKPGQYLGFLRDRTFTPRELLRLAARMGARRARRLLARREPKPARTAAPEALEPGEWVQVLSSRQIEATLDARRCLNGLAFSGEMHEFCGRRLRVAARVTRLIAEGTGRLRDVRGTVALEGAVCDRYLGCARGMPLLWREAWLRRAEAPAQVALPIIAAPQCP